MKLELLPGRSVGDSESCFIVAEAGQNHQGDVNVAMDLIKMAASAKCDCVKFQKSSLRDKFTRDALERPYDSPHSFGATYGQHKEFLELTNEQFHHLQRFATNEGIAFTASAMDIKSVDFLLALNVPFLKIGSGDTDNFPMLEYVASKNHPVVYSTGMHNFDVIRSAYSILTKHNPIGLLHCVSSYPTPFTEINLNVLKTFQNSFPKAVVGYSGHELGVAPSLAAVAMGAKILERHITLDKTLKGNDHSSSLDPHELRSLVTQVRQIEQSMGSYEKVRQPSEKACHDKLGKSLVAAVDIPSGTVVTQYHLGVKVAQPRGLDARLFCSLIGKTTQRHIQFDEAILQCDVE